MYLGNQWFNALRLLHYSASCYIAMILRTCSSTVNHEIFIVKIVSDSMDNAKIMCIINANAVQDHLSKNYSTRKFIARNIFDTKY